MLCFLSFYFHQTPQHNQSVMNVYCLQVAQLLGSASSLLKPELIRLLRDDAEEVLQVLVPHLGKTLVLLAKAGTFSPDFMVST
jgi:hypothetical protein